MIDEYYLYTFESTHGAISTEKILKKVGCIVMPVPRHISTSCGIACRVEPAKFADSVQVFKENSELEPGEYLIYHIQHDKANDKYDFETTEI